jgi:hypothetical protein
MMASSRLEAAPTKQQQTVGAASSRDRNDGYIGLMGLIR